MNHPSSEARLERLEILVEAITREMQALRRELRLQPQAGGEGLVAGGGQPSPAGSPLHRGTPAERSAPVGVDPLGWTAEPHAKAPDVRAGTYVPSGHGGLRPKPPGWRGDASRPQPLYEFAAPPRRPTSDQIEKLAGRYGMLALATLTGLAAVGTFVSWAAEHVKVGPEARLVMGLLVAAALAGVGMRIRPRERSFGAVLMGLALAVVHVCAWAAGPGVLQIVPATISFTLALLASITLASFAAREEDEPLWCTGFGGAAVAPFVTTDGSGPAFMLMLYGGAVMLAGCWALRARIWPIAGRVLTLSGALYVGALLASPDREGAPLMALALALVVAGAGVIPFAAEEMRRSRLRAFGVLSAVAALSLRFADGLPGGTSTAVTATAIAGLIWTYFLDRTADLPSGSILDGLLDEGSTVWEWADAAFIPLAFIAALLSGVTGPAWHDAIPATLAAGVMLAFTASRPIGAMRNAAAFTVCVSALIAALALGDGSDPWMFGILAVPAVGFVLANTRVTASPWLPMATLALGACSLGALASLGTRTKYAYLPFGTEESFVAMAVVLAWAASSVLVRRSDPATDGELARHRPAGMHDAAQRPGTMFSAAGWVTAFFWVHQELSGAVSRTTSTLLLISYYAVTAFVLVGAGRHYGIATLRHIGLLMALLAAASAARGATKLDAVWAQIAGYVVTSMFLLALAWWYRQRGSGEEPAAAAGETVAAAPVSTAGQA